MNSPNPLPTDQQIKERLMPYLEQIIVYVKNKSRSADLTDVQIQLEQKQDVARLEFISYLLCHRIYADSLEYLIVGVKNYDPERAAREQKAKEIARLQAELAALMPKPESFAGDPDVDANDL